MRYPRYPECKDSYVEWLKKIPAYWDVKRLRFCIISNPVKSEIKNMNGHELVSFVPMEALHEYGGIDLSQTKMLEEVYGGYTYFKENDVVLAKITPCFENGKGSIVTGLENGIGFGSTEFHVLRPLEDLDRKYLFYLTISYSFRKNGEAIMIGAGGHKRITEDYIKDFTLAIPPRNEQKKIAAFLDYKTQQIDQLIEKKKALIEKLNEQRIAVITQAVTKGLDKNAKMKPSGVDWLGDVPAHWEITKLRYCTSFVTSGSRGWAKYFSDSGDIFLRITNLTRDSIKLLTDDIQRVQPPLSAEGERSQTAPGDILISITADLGSVAVIPNDCEPSFVSQHVSLVRPENYKVVSEWLAFTVFSHIGRAQLLGAGYGGTKQQLSLADIKDLVFVLPKSLEEQKDIIGEMQQIIFRIEQMLQINNQAIERLIEYRSAIITAAVTGKIDVRNTVIPAKAGIQAARTLSEPMDTRLRGYD